MVALIIIVVLVLWICVSCIKIVPQAQAYVIERLGAYQSTWNVGFNLKIPFIDKVARKVNLKEQVADFPPQPVITKDNVTMRIDTVVFYQITDPKLFTYGVENPMMAIENLTATTLRNIHQHQDACGTGYRHRSLGYQGQPCGAEEHHPSRRDPECHGEADEGRA